MKKAKTGRYVITFPNISGDAWQFVWINPAVGETSMGNPLAVHLEVGETNKTYELRVSSQVSKIIQQYIDASPNKLAVGLLVPYVSKMDAACKPIEELLCSVSIDHSDTQIQLLWEKLTEVQTLHKAIGDWAENYISGAPQTSSSGIGQQEVKSNDQRQQSTLPFLLDLASAVADLEDRVKTVMTAI